jgi:hypothetical protein
VPILDYTPCPLKAICLKGCSVFPPRAGAAKAKKLRASRSRSPLQQQRTTIPAARAFSPAPPQRWLLGVCGLQHAAELATSCGHEREGGSKACANSKFAQKDNSTNLLMSFYIFQLYIRNQQTLLKLTACPILIS